MKNFLALNKAKIFYFIAPVILAFFFASVLGSPLDGYNGQLSLIQKTVINYYLLVIVFSLPSFFLVYLLLLLFTFGSPLFNENTSDLSRNIFDGLFTVTNVVLGYIQWFYLVPKFYPAIRKYIKNGRSPTGRLIQVILTLLVITIIITCIYIAVF